MRGSSILLALTQPERLADFSSHPALIAIYWHRKTLDEQSDQSKRLLRDQLATFSQRDLKSVTSTVLKIC